MAARDGETAFAPISARAATERMGSLNRRSLDLHMSQLLYIIRAVPPSMRGSLRGCLLLVSALPMLDLGIVYWVYILMLTLQGEAFGAPGAALFQGDSGLLYAVGGFIALTLLRQGAEYGSIHATRHFTQALFRHFSGRLTDRYLSLAWVDFIADTKAARLKHITSTALDSAYSYQVVFNFVGSLVSLVALTLSMLVINVYVAIGGAALLLLFSFVSRRLTRHKIERLTTRHHVLERRFYDRVQETLTLFREIRMFRAQETMSGRVRQELHALSDVKLQMSTYPHVPRLLLELVFTVTLGLCLLPLAVSGERSMPELIAELASLALLSRRIIPSMALLLTAFTELDGTCSQLKALFHELESGEAPVRGDSAAAPLPPALLELDAVSFGYRAQTPVVAALSLRISPGERVAVTGETGSGKSTLLMLCAGLLQPAFGRVLLAPALAALPDGVAYVPQETALLGGTIADNVAFGADGPDEALIWRVLEQVKLAEAVRRLPQGLHTPAGDNGVFLSGGERQRLGLARALYRRPRLLLLDEATSALDEPTEDEIMQRLHRWMGEGSIVFITHRQTNAARHATRIVHLTKARTAEEERK